MISVHLDIYVSHIMDSVVYYVVNIASIKAEQFSRFERFPKHEFVSNKPEF